MSGIVFAGIGVSDRRTIFLVYEDTLPVETATVVLCCMSVHSMRKGEMSVHGPWKGKQRREYAAILFQSFYMQFLFFTPSSGQVISLYQYWIWLFVDSLYEGLKQFQKCFEIVLRLCTKKEKHPLIS